MPAVDDLWVIAAYFNAAAYATRRANYNRFTRALDRQGVRHLTVECAFGDEPFTLPPSSTVLRCRSGSVLWQKERLLNVALSALPPHVTKVAWLDADVLFENARWADETSRLLNRCQVVQPFESVVRLKRRQTKDSSAGDSWVGFCAQQHLSPGCERIGWEWHGHSGFAWAARRQLLDRCGFFDLCLAGCGDHLMAHGFLGDAHSYCIEAMVGLETPLHRAFVRWTELARQGPETIGFVSGTLLHLWHGEMCHRRYHERAQELKALRYDPARHIDLVEGSWSLNGGNPRLKQWAADMFATRREDGDRLT